MAGHSQFKNIMHRKGRQDAIRAKVFTKLGKEIQVAAKMGGGDPDSNPRLRLAVQAARAQNMPKDNIQRAINKAIGADADNLDEIRYEGYGPGGVAIIVETLTDNRNRTAAEIRAAFNKNGGSLGETNSVSFQFDRVGQIRFGLDAGDHETLLEAGIEAGADDVETDSEGHTVYCAADDLNAVREGLEAALNASAEEAILGWRPQATVPVNEDQASTLMKLLEVLDDNDDTQRVVANADISEDVLAKLNEAA